MASHSNRTRLTLKEIIQQLCLIFDSADKPPHFLAVGGHPNCGKIVVFSANKASTESFLDSQLKEERPFVPIQILQADPFVVDLLSALRIKKPLAKSPDCEKGGGGWVQPGSWIWQSVDGTASCLVRFEGKTHLLTAEHVLLLGDTDPIEAGSKKSPHVVAHSTKVHGDLLDPNQRIGDFELGIVCKSKGVGTSSRPECETMPLTGAWVSRKAVSTLCDRPVLACSDGNVLHGTVVGVEVCVDVTYTGLPTGHAQDVRRFEHHIILEGPSVGHWKPGHSGSLVVCSDSRDGVNAGDAVGVAYCVAGKFVCVTPFFAIAEEIERTTHKKISIQA